MNTNLWADRTACSDLLSDVFPGVAPCGVKDGIATHHEAAPLLGALGSADGVSVQPSNSISVLKLLDGLIEANPLDKPEVAERNRNISIASDAVGELIHRASMMMRYLECDKGVKFRAEIDLCVCPGGRAIDGLRDALAKVGSIGGAA